MKSNKLICLLILLGFMAGYAVDAPAVWIYSPKTGKWSNPKHTLKDTPREQFEHAVSFEKKKDYDRAAKEFSKLVKGYPRNEMAPKALMRAAKNYEMAGYYFKAFEAYQKVIEQYPGYEDILTIIDKEYRIGNLFLAGQKRKVLKLAILPSREKAIEIFRKVVENAPFGPLAPKAQLRIGMTYEKKKKYREAIEEYQRLIQNHPESPLAADALFRQAWCGYKLSRGADYDQASTDDAIRYLQKFLGKHPDNEKAEQARVILTELESRKAAGMLSIGDYYMKLKKSGAAAVYYRKLIEEYPESPEAETAGELLKAIEPSQSDPGEQKEEGF